MVVRRRRGVSRAGRLDRAAGSVGGDGRGAVHARVAVVSRSRGERNEGESEERRRRRGVVDLHLHLHLERLRRLRLASRVARLRGVAPPATYARVMHALCDARATRGGARDPRVYARRRHLRIVQPAALQTLFKATAARAGRAADLPPRKAAARTVADAVPAAVAVSRGEAPFLPTKRRTKRRTTPTTNATTNATANATSVAVAFAFDGATASRWRRLRAMATATALGDATLSATAIRATLQVAAAGGFPDVASEARARMRWTRVPRPRIWS